MSYKLLTIRKLDYITAKFPSMSSTVRIEKEVMYFYNCELWSYAKEKLMQRLKVLEWK